MMKKLSGVGDFSTRQRCIILFCLVLALFDLGGHQLFLILELIHIPLLLASLKDLTIARY